MTILSCRPIIIVQIMIYGLVFQRPFYWALHRVQVFLGLRPIIFVFRERDVSLCDVLVNFPGHKLESLLRAFSSSGLQDFWRRWRQDWTLSRRKDEARSSVK